jgi:biopolymer transport protein TolR
MGDINVTPLVDVMLVLLIIFMVTAPLMNQGVELELPRATGQPLDTQPDQLIISIDKDLRYYLNENEIPAADLKVRLKAIAAEAPGQAVFLRGDGSIPYKYVLALMADVKNAGISKVGMVSNPGEEAVPPAPPERP